MDINNLFELLKASQQDDAMHSIELEIAVYHLSLDLETSEDS